MPVRSLLRILRLYRVCHKDGLDAILTEAIASIADKQFAPFDSSYDSTACNRVELLGLFHANASFFRAMYDGGWKFPDEHKMFAHLLGHEDYFSEMNVLDGQWMSRVTSHVSLRQAVEQINRPAIEAAIMLATSMMRKAGIAEPRLAVAALNPHGGEGGLFGTEEIEIIRPAVEAMAAKGIACEGPFPSDTVYLKAFAGHYDGVLSMYHDQGQIATKMRGFNRGVTVTGGLKTVFTTPAHGTAFDIVGKGVADTGAIQAAIALASRLVVAAASARA